jgi:hypothetical protein
MRARRRKPSKPFDKYYYYNKAVQIPAVDTAFFSGFYKTLRKKKGKVLREDFCGTFLDCMEWVKLDPSFVAHGIDLDPEPLAYGRTNLLPKLTPEQQSRVFILNKNVLDNDLPQADIIVSKNFSNFIFKKRSEMKYYFEKVLSGLNKDGIFIQDCFGGWSCYFPHEEQKRIRNFDYFWDQCSFNPITNEAFFYIHFKVKGQKKIHRVFSCDFRLWSVAELREILSEVGFQNTYVYWEGELKDEGSYNFSEVGEPFESWAVYIIGSK